MKSQQQKEGSTKEGYEESVSFKEKSGRLERERRKVGGKWRNVFRMKRIQKTSTRRTKGLKKCLLRLRGRGLRFLRRRGAFRERKKIVFKEEGKLTAGGKGRVEMRGKRENT